MEHKPRPLRQPVLSSSQWARIVFLGLVIAVGTLYLEAAHEGTGTPEELLLATTVGATAFSLYNIFAGLIVRDETRTAFNLEIFGDRHQLILYGLVVLLTYLATEMGFLQNWLGTTALTGDQWLLCFLVAFSLVLIDEAIKFFMRRSRKPRREPAVPMVPAVDVR
jgi:Ca2+-transporting ATPase